MKKIEKAEGLHIRVKLSPHQEVCVVPQLDREYSHNGEYFSQKITGYKVDADCKLAH